MSEKALFFLQVSTYHPWRVDELIDHNLLNLGPDKPNFTIWKPARFGVDILTGGLLILNFHSALLTATKN